MLQLEVRNAFSDVTKILVPGEAGLTILKGATYHLLATNTATTSMTVDRLWS